MKKIIFFVVLLISALGAYCQEQNHNPYKLFEQSLDGISHLKPGHLTVFRNIDINVANPRFTRYVEDNGLRNDDSGFKWHKDGMQLRFIPSVSDGTPYITVRYFTQDKKGIPMQYPTSNGLTAVITKVVIEGTPDLIIRLFLNYWSSNVQIGGYVQGDIASLSFLGDHVVLSGVSPTKYRITIGRGNVDVDYYSTYKIK